MDKKIILLGMIGLIALSGVLNHDLTLYKPEIVQLELKDMRAGLENLFNRSEKISLSVSYWSLKHH